MGENEPCPSSSSSSRLLGLLDDRRRVGPARLLLLVGVGLGRLLAALLAARVGLGDEALELAPLVVALLGLDVLEDGADEEDGLRAGERGEASGRGRGV